MMEGYEGPSIGVNTQGNVEQMEKEFLVKRKNKVSQVDEFFQKGGHIDENDGEEGMLNESKFDTYKFDTLLSDRLGPEQLQEKKKVAKKNNIGLKQSSSINERSKKKRQKVQI